ncbi:unnamed protein product [Phaeothamnion confervicola]
MLVAADLPERIKGLILLNSAGRFGVLNPLGIEIPLLKWPPIAKRLGKFLFENARDPDGVRSTLKSVYHDKMAVTDELVQLILKPATTAEAEAAGPVLFASLFTAAQGRGWKELLGGEKGYNGPLLLCWGRRDPWIVAAYVNELTSLRSDADVAWVEAGHCPHDEAPEEVNTIIREWVLTCEQRQRAASLS